MKKTLKLFMILLIATFLVACGNETTEQENYGTIDQNAADLKAEIEAEKDKAEAEANKKDKEINPQSEKELEINLNGTKVKLFQTWEEFDKLVSDNGWKYIDNDNISDDYSGRMAVTTNVGDIDFYFMPNQEATGAELYKVIISPVKIDYSADVDICGVNVFTEKEKIADKLELIRDLGNSCKYSLHENVTLTTQLFKNDPMSYILTIERTPYDKR